VKVLTHCIFYNLFCFTEEIVNRFARDQPIELQEAIWKKCLYSISTKCKVLRAQKQNLGGIIYDDEYNEMRVGGDLDLLANVTCPENQREIHRALMEHSEHLVAQESQEARGGDDMEHHEGDMVEREGEVGQQGNMMGQEDSITSQEGDIVEEEGDIVEHARGIVEERNPITVDEVAMEHEQEVTATIQIDQSNGLCEQHIQVGELVEHEHDYV
jgi:hypothetical protein